MHSLIIGGGKIGYYLTKVLIEKGYDVSVVEKEKEILKAQALNEGKPEAIVEKMVGGRIKKFYKEVLKRDGLFSQFYFLRL